MAKRVTQHSGRTNKQGKAYSTKHNDRSFDAEAENIIKELTPNNITWHGYQTLYPDMTFEDAEKMFYDYRFTEALEKSNEKYIKSGHKERVKTMDEWRTSKMHCPEEVIIQVGKLDETIDAETFKACFDEYLKAMCYRCGSSMQILDYAIHVDEAVPHAHIRRVWMYEKDGVVTTGQEQALKSIGVKLPNEAEAPSRKNNRKMTFDAEMRQVWLDIVEARGIEVEREPIPNAPHNRTKSKLIRDENKRLIEENKQVNKNIEIKSQELSNISQELSEAQKGLYKTKEEVLDLSKQENALKSQIEAERNELSIVRAEHIKQADIRDRAEKKDVFGKGKGIVEVPIDEYMTMQWLNSQVPDVVGTRKRLEERSKEINKAIDNLNHERAEFEQIKAKAEDNIANAPKYKEDAARYRSWWNDEKNKTSKLEKDIADIHNDLDQVTIDLAAANKTIKEKEKEILKQKEKSYSAEKELSKYQKIFGKIKDWVWEKLEKIFVLEEILKNPFGEISRQNRELNNLIQNVYDEVSAPYAIKGNSDTFYYWQGGAGTRSQCFTRAYMPMAEDIEKELGHVDMLDQNLLAEGRKYLQQEKQLERQHSRGLSR